MKRPTLTLLCLVTLILTAFAQRPTTDYPEQQKIRRSSNDSLRYYQEEMNRYMKSTWDSIRNTEEYIALTEGLGRARAESQRYFGSMLAGEVVHADYKEFNESIAQSGFDPLKSTMTRIGFGISTKNKRRIFEWRFAMMGINNKTKKDGEKITSSLTSVFDFIWGYDFIASPQIDLYPYAGIGVRGSTINYVKPRQVNSSFSDITNIITNNQSASATSTRLGYMAGVGLDIKLSPSHELNRSPMFFLKFGVNNPFGDEKYKIEGVRYKPGIKQGDWIVGFGFKFLVRS